MDEERNRMRRLNRKLNNMWRLNLTKRKISKEDCFKDMNYWITDESGTCDTWFCKDLDDVEFFIRVGDIVDYFLMLEEAQKMYADKLKKINCEEGREIVELKKQYRPTSIHLFDILHEHKIA